MEREICERIWFVYCKSENAEKSVYVQKERSYLETLVSQGKQINKVEIELDKFNIWDNECYDYIRKQIEYKIRKTKIFISYSHADRSVFDLISTELDAHGYSVWSDLDISCGDIFKNAIRFDL